MSPSVLMVIISLVFIECTTTNYIYVSTPKDWSSAESYCKSVYGTNLASIHSVQENNELKTLTSNLAWIGLNDKSSERGTSRTGWVWTDGSSFDYSDWYATEPSNSGMSDNSNEDCVEINFQSQWNDEVCSLAKPFICNRYPPTASPSNYPTLAPSHIPTTEPSYSPTASPSFIPSAAPSNAPSQSPTACIDYSVGGIERYYSNDGIDRKSKINILEWVNKSFEINTNDIMLFDDKVSEENIVPYLDKLISCNSTNDTICSIKCLSTLSCNNAQIISNSESMEQILAECGAKRACKSMTFNYSNQNSPFLKKIVINCAISSSCDGLTLNLFSSFGVESNMTDLEITIYCLQSLACQNFEINLQKTGQNTTINLLCFYENSCKQANIVNLNENENIKINMFAYDFSESVIIKTKRFDSIEIECGNMNDSRFMRYDTKDLMNDQELLQRARSEYASNHMPCEEIEIICLNEIDTKEYTQHCVYEYSLSEMVDISQIINSKVGCYWIDINKLYTPRCIGTCGQNITIYEHAMNIKFDLRFGLNSKDRKDAKEHFDRSTIAQTICDEYFGSINVTEDTLSDIDVILSASLKFLWHKSSNQIHGVSSNPHSFLSDGSSYINCTNDSNIGSISSTFTIQTLTNDSSEYEPLFEKDSVFSQVTNEYLNTHFDGKLLAVFPTQLLNVSALLHKWWYWLAVIGAPSFLLIIIIALIIYSYRQKRMRDLKTMWISNPMIISIAIGFYDVQQHLHRIEEDLRSIHHLFELMLGYKVYPPFKPLTEHPKIRWSRSEILSLLRAKAKELNENLTSNNPNTIKYDALIVSLSGHGLEHRILSSDEKFIGTTAIHRIFSGKYAQNRSIPRIFIYDSCSGAEEKNRSPSPSLEGFNRMKSVQISSETEQVEKFEVATRWEYEQDNPDHLLVTLKASNIGFQSKMNTMTGSYFIHSLYQMLKWSIAEKKNYYFLGELFDKIQSELHNKCQLPEMTAFSGTQFIKFKKNKIEIDEPEPITFHGSKSGTKQTPIGVDDDEEKEMFEFDLEELSVDKDGINCNPLEPVPDTVVKYDELNEDLPALQKGAEIQMQQMICTQSTGL